VCPHCLIDASQSAAQFLDAFRNNLIDIKIDPTPYGCHSFRRGGCQYYYTERGWDLRDLCSWGGWSLDLTKLQIVQYLFSTIDTAPRQRSEFQLARPRTGLCHVCKRSCRC
jgi:hypothetical protein